MSVDAYVRKMLLRAEGIWHNLGLSLSEKRVEDKNGIISVYLTFPGATKLRAELLVAGMSVAFRRARVHWQDTDPITVVVQISNL
jgi:hypothetical protein